VGVFCGGGGGAEHCWKIRQIEWGERERRSDFPLVRKSYLHASVGG